jgi:cytosine/adenosine deaminase-related metal-dependent hydrolase
MRHATSAIWGTLEKHATTFIKGVLIPDEAVDGGYGYSCVDVTLAGGKIAALVPTGVAPVPEGCIVIDGGNKLLLPGAVNAHTHTSEHWARGLIKPLPLELWIHQLVRRVSSYTAWGARAARRRLFARLVTFPLSAPCL